VVVVEPPRQPQHTDWISAIRVLPSVYETREMPAQDRIDQIMAFYSGRDLAKAKRIAAGLEPDEARRALDDAICADKL
jgi:hypothetical protein